MLDDATTASIRGLGQVVPPVPLPGADVLTGPEVVWADLQLPPHVGAAFFDTAPEHLASATATVYASTGHVNVERGTIRVTAQVLAPIATPTAGA